MNRPTKRKVNRKPHLHGFALVILSVGLGGPSRVAAYNIADDDGAFTHEVMTKQALDLHLFYTQATPGPFAQEISNFWQGSGINVSEGSIQFGVGEPDRFDPLYNNSGLGGALTTITHFWRPDVSLGAPMTFDPPAQNLNDYPNAFQVAQALWTRALGFYAAGNKPEAYRHLGMVAHFLGDQSIPTHAHNDTHGPDVIDYDGFEEWMSKTGPRSPGDPRPVVLSVTESPNAVLYADELASLQALGKLEPPAALGLQEIDDRFLWIFLAVNQVADCFGSDGEGFGRLDDDGNFTHPSDPRVAGWVQGEIDRIAAANLVEQNLLSQPGLPTTTARLTANEADNHGAYDFITSQSVPNDDDGDLSLIRKYSYFQGIRGIAALFALWEDAISEPIIYLTVQEIKEIGQDDPLGTIGMDSYLAPDFFVGMVMGRNQRMLPVGDNPDGYGAYLETRTGTLRYINGADFPSNVTRRDAFRSVAEGGTQDATTVTPNYPYGQSYIRSVGASGYQVGQDVVRIKFDVWENDTSGEVLNDPYDSDDPADIAPSSSYNLPISVDLAKALAGDDEAVTVEGQYFPCSTQITMAGFGNNPDDVQVKFTVNVFWANRVKNNNDSGTGSLRDVIGSAIPLIQFYPKMSGETITLTTGDISIDPLPVKISGEDFTGTVKINAAQSTRIGPPSP